MALWSRDPTSQRSQSAKYTILSNLKSGVDYLPPMNPFKSFQVPLLLGGGKAPGHGSLGFSITKWQGMSFHRSEYSNRCNEALWFLGFAALKMQLSSARHRLMFPRLWPSPRSPVGDVVDKHMHIGISPIVYIRDTQPCQSVHPDHHKLCQDLPQNCTNPRPGRRVQIGDRSRSCKMDLQK